MFTESQSRSMIRFAATISVAVVACGPQTEPGGSASQEAPEDQGESEGEGQNEGQQQDPPEPKPYVCDDNVKDLELSAEDQAKVDKLWNQALAYLRGYLAALETPDGCPDTGRAIVQTYSSDLNGPETRCITRYRDVQLVAKHVKWVLDHPDMAKDCFDAQKDYGEFDLYTPSAAMKEKYPVTAWLDRKTLEDFYKDREGPIGDAGRTLVENFAGILSNTSSKEYIGEDITFNALPELWTSVGWLPFYADNDKAINAQFRGGYAYAEVMGPWGLLRIKSIEGEPVGAEIGMTIQAGKSFYPYHFHHPQEIYMTLTKPECQGQNIFMTMQWDNDAFSHENTEKGWDVTVRKAIHAGQQWYLPQSPSEGEWLTYFERNAIHANTVGEKCGDSPAGLTAVWTRTTARDNVQTTRICVPIDDDGQPVEAEEVGPEDPFVCHLEDWDY